MMDDHETNTFWRLGSPDRAIITVSLPSMVLMIFKVSSPLSLAIRGCASSVDRPLNDVLSTVVNWMFYFAVIEGAFVLKRKFSTRG